MNFAAFWQNVLIASLASTLAVPTGFAQDEQAPRRLATPMPRTVNAVEYESSSMPGEVLLSVSVLGAVQRPGVYRIPKLTELHKVIALAGGPLQNADLVGVTIKSGEQGKNQITKVDLRQVLTESNSSPYTLRPDDIVMVPTDEPLISQNTVAALSVISTILTIVVTSIVISQSRD